MGKKGGGGTQTSTTVQKNELPAWVNNASQGNYAEAQTVAQGLKDYGTYKGNTVSGLNDDHNAAFQMARDSAGMADPYFQTAGNTLQGLQGYTGQQVSTSQFSPEALAQYQNPYLEATEKYALENMDRQRRTALTQVGDQASSAGAFGGSRQGIAEAVLNSEAARSAGDLSNTIRSEGYDKAFQMFNTDRNAQMQADLANQGQDLAAAQLRGNSANSLAQVGQGRQQSYLQSAAAVQAIADAQRQYQQDLLNQDQQRWQDQRMLPLEALNVKQTALGLSPYETTQTSTSTQPKQQQNTGLGILGGVSSLLGSVLPFFSDEDEKTNKQPLGKDPATGIPLYAYDYKADVAAAKKSGSPMPPKRVGPMAGDIEKMKPGSVTKVGGKKVVNLEAPKPKKKLKKKGGK